MWKGREPPSRQPTTRKFSWPFHTDTYVHASLNTLVLFFLSPSEHRCDSAGWFFSGKSFYRTAAFGLNMQDSPSDRKNMANALALVCEGRVSSGTGRVRVWRDARTQDERRFNFILLTTKSMFYWKWAECCSSIHYKAIYIYIAKIETLGLLKFEKIPPEKGELSSLLIAGHCCNMYFFLLLFCSKVKDKYWNSLHMFWWTTIKNSDDSVIEVLSDFNPGVWPPHTKLTFIPIFRSFLLQPERHQTSPEIHI